VSALALITASRPEDPLLDMALTHALLDEVAAGRHPPALRLFRPGPSVAFGRQDALRPGFAEACRRARARGYTPVVRPAGGHAAVYDAGSVIVEHVSAEHDATARLQQRFATLAEHLRAGLAALGADVRIGELPGEYCPGAYSLNLGGELKLKVAGIAQRVVRHGALTTATVTATGGAALRATVAEVYAALALDVDVSVAGAVDEVLPGVTAGTVLEAIHATYGPLDEREPPAYLLALARGLEGRHAAPR
jgi:lipoate-protein ligase A